MDVLSTSQTAKLLGISRCRVIQLINSGQLKASRLGNAFLIKPKDLENLKKSRNRTNVTESKEARQSLLEYGFIYSKGPNAIMRKGWSKDGVWWGTTAHRTLHSWMWEMVK